MRDGLLAMGLCLAWIGCAPHEPGTRGEVEASCRGDAQCETGLVCQEGLCRPEIRGRFCNCVRVERLTVRVGEVALSADHGECSSCQRMPWGPHVAYRVEDASHTAIEEGRLDLALPEPTDIILEPLLNRLGIPSSTSYWVVGCHESRWSCPASD